MNLYRLLSGGGTASIVDAITVEESAAIQTKSLTSIIANYPQFQNSQLLKIDTDGFDFFIIKSSIDIISQLSPVLYFEYDITFEANGESAGLETIQSLFEIGYEYFIVYDNYGNYLISLSNDEYDRFLDLTTYLASNRKRSGTPVVYYFDICAFTEKDKILIYLKKFVWEKLI